MLAGMASSSSASEGEAKDRPNKIAVPHAKVARLAAGISAELNNLLFIFESFWDQALYRCFMSGQGDGRVHNIQFMAHFQPKFPPMRQGLTVFFPYTFCVRKFGAFDMDVNAVAILSQCQKFA
jgi:hypothetical protein